MYGLGLSLGYNKIYKYYGNYLNTYPTADEELERWYNQLGSKLPTFEDALRHKPKSNDGELISQAFDMGRYAKDYIVAHRGENGQPDTMTRYDTKKQLLDDLTTKGTLANKGFKKLIKDPDFKNLGKSLDDVITNHGLIEDPKNGYVFLNLHKSNAKRYFLDKTMKNYILDEHDDYISSTTSSHAPSQSHSALSTPYHSPTKPTNYAGDLAAAATKLMTPKKRGGKREGSGRKKITHGHGSQSQNIIDALGIKAVEPVKRVGSEEKAKEEAATFIQKSNEREQKKGRKTMSIKDEDMGIAKEGTVEYVQLMKQQEEKAKAKELKKSKKREELNARRLKRDLEREKEESKITQAKEFEISEPFIKSNKLTKPWIAIKLLGNGNYKLEQLSSLDEVKNTHKKGSIVAEVNDNEDFKTSISEATSWVDNLLDPKIFIIDRSHNDTNFRSIIATVLIPYMTKTNKEVKSTSIGRGRGLTPKGTGTGGTTKRKYTRK